MNGFSFHDPLWLSGGVVVALVAFLAARRSRRGAITFSSLADLRGLPVTFAQRMKRLLPLMRVTGLLLVVVALARPRQGLEEFRVRTEGIAIELAIDRSGSMRALDFRDEGEPVDRLHVVKRVVRDFVEGQAGSSELGGRKDDKIGLVVFSGYAEGRCPLTLDHDTLLKILDDVKLPFEGMSDSQAHVVQRYLEDEGSTAIGDALARAVAGLDGSDAKSRVVILLSDGESNAGLLSPRDAAELAKAKGIKVYTIGIGSTGVAPVLDRDMFGREVLKRMNVRLDDRTLREIAEVTGGAYFNARDTEALEAVYGKIDELEKSETEGLVYTDYRELFGYVLVPGILLLLLELVLRSTRFLSLP